MLFSDCLPVLYLQSGSSTCHFAAGGGNVNLMLQLFKNQPPETINEPNTVRYSVWHSNLMLLEVFLSSPAYAWIYAFHCTPCYQLLGISKKLVTLKMEVLHPLAKVMLL